MNDIVPVYNNLFGRFIVYGSYDWVISRKGYFRTYVVQHITFLLDINTHDLLSIAITSSEQYFSYILGVVLLTTEHSPCFTYRSFFWFGFNYFSFYSRKYFKHLHGVPTFYWTSVHIVHPNSLIMYVYCEHAPWRV